MRALVARDLADSKVAGLSADRRFATAYNAALQAANMAIACAGYRVTAKTGHHKVALDSVKLAVGNTADKYADYFDRCRRKRNVIDYTRSHVATESEASQIVQQAVEFYGVRRGLDRIGLPEAAALTADELINLVGTQHQISRT